MTRVARVRSQFTSFYFYLTVEKIIVRHFRGNTELPYLAEENNYDFNFQDFRRFEEKKVILPGDQITVECTYNTESLDRPMFVR